MTITVEAVYENGVFRPLAAVPFQEHAAVRLTVHSFEHVTPPTDSEKSDWHRNDRKSLLARFRNSRARYRRGAR